MRTRHQFYLEFLEWLFRPNHVPRGCHQLDFYVVMKHGKGKNPNEVIILISRNKNSRNVPKGEHLLDFLAKDGIQNGLSKEAKVSFHRGEMKIVFQRNGGDDESAYYAMSVAMTCLEKVKDEIRLLIPNFVSQT